MWDDVSNCLDESRPMSLAFAPKGRGNHREEGRKRKKHRTDGGMGLSLSLSLDRTYSPTYRNMLDYGASGTPDGSNLIERIERERPASGEVRMSDLELDRKMDLLSGLLARLAIVRRLDGKRYSIYVFPSRPFFLNTASRNRATASTSASTSEKRSKPRRSCDG